MNNIVPRSFWIAPLAALALFGAGCFQPEAAPAATPPAANVPAVQVPAKPVVPAEVPTTPIVVPTTPSGYKLPEIDASWLTYTDRAETYSFMYPTKGKYAPAWSAKIIAENDPAYKDGCYFDTYSPEQPSRKPVTKITLNGVEFCHESLGDGFAGGFGFVDTYTTKVGTQIISVLFEKIAHSAGACMDSNAICKQAFDQQAMVLAYAGGSYAVFVESEYAQHLDQIMGTFKKLK